MNVEELMKKYNELAAKPLASPSQENESGESVATLYQSSSLRILLVRTSEEPESVSIEVEVWLPSVNSENGSDETTNSDIEHNNDRLGVILGRVINHLSYLLKLHQSGFNLDVIKHDCLWTASKSFSKPPTRMMFEHLLPP